ncbi:conserved hypothetical protein [Vibrio rotiferianus]|uniref:hypothetical protein n=1 Tax=Vibrio rotiferianus TaxID=190895 RepID=UPI002893DCA2|nr:conserved hypothetical protein [Vibrio rotiferianus]
MKIQHFEVNSGKLILNGDEYNLQSIIEIEARHLTAKNHSARALSLAFLFSLVGWAFSPAISAASFVIGVFFALVTAKKYELRALFKSSDDAGNQWGRLSHSSKADDFAKFSIIATEVTNYKNTSNSKY